MFIHPPSIQDIVKKAGLAGISRKQEIAERGQRRYQYLFQSSPMHSNKSLYRHMVAVVNQFINQIIGREGTPGKKAIADNGHQVGVRQVRGIADRMPRLVDPANPKPEHDSVFLGEARDYPAPVLAIEYNNMTKPVFYEGNQVVARHLYLDCQDKVIQGQLVLNDGTRMPIEILVFTAV
ncbi:MAG: hypothetical protein R3F02_16925 [Thiolinea sp.]